MNKAISSPQNPYVKHLVKLRENASYRREQQRVLIVGNTMVREFQGTIIHTISTEQTSKDHILVTPEVMKKIAGTVAPEELAAEVKLPQEESLERKNKLLVLDRISDPGNMGTIIRTALALGWEGAYLIEGSCDPYNEKALRAAKGATFRFPLQSISWNILKTLIENGKWKPFAADMNGVPVNDIEHVNNPLLILGNEAQGISMEAKRLSQLISIPMSGQIESLNVSVAAGILMYSLFQIK